MLIEVRVQLNGTLRQDIDRALHILRSMSDQGDKQERDAATVLAAYIDRAVRDQRRARMAGTRLLRAARRAAARFSTYSGLPTEHAHAKIKRYAPR